MIRHPTTSLFIQLIEDFNFKTKMQRNQEKFLNELKSTIPQYKKVKGIP